MAHISVSNHFKRFWFPKVTHGVPSSISEKINKYINNTVALLEKQKNKNAVIVGNTVIYF